MMARRQGRTAGRLAAGLVALALGGCTYGGFSDALGPTECDVETARTVDKAGWDNAAVVVIRVRQDEFSPMLVEFERGRPYILQLVNGDDRDHVFRSPGFFENISMAGVSRGSDELSHVCRTSLLIPARKTAEVRFVAVRDGHFDFYDSGLPMVFPGESSGIAIIR